MPHRFEQLSPLVYLIEAALLGLAAGYKVAEATCLALTEQDWSKLLGPQGFTVGLILAVIVLWGNGIARERNETKRREKEESNETKRREKEEASREARHRETLALQRENSEKLMNLSVEAIKAKGMMVAAFNNLVEELEGRPCSAFKSNLTRVESDKPEMQ
jgi:hypothetical protein